jgi:hypothetical protein
MKYVNGIELGSDKARSFLKDAETTKCQLPKLKVAGSNPVSRSIQIQGIPRDSFFCTLFFDHFQPHFGQNGRFIYCR